MERSPEKREGHVTASVLLGGCLLECFIAADALACPPREIQGFTEEHYHASYELLLCQGGAGFQFANGTAYGPPDGYTKEDLLTALEGGKDTLPSIWTNLDELDIDPDILY